MAACEMCGKISNLLTTDIEGSILRVCAECANYGQVRRASSEGMYRRGPVKQMPQEEFEVVGNFSTLLRHERTKRGLTQTDFARLLAEKDSVVAKWEVAAIKPDLDVARRVGKILGLTLVVKQNGVAVEKAELPVPKRGATEFTLGDFVKVRKRK